MQDLTRRRVFRGVLHGGVVSVALPFLNYFLDGNGAALASGAPMPVRFGSWFWGCGMNENIFVPKKGGADYDVPQELRALAPFRDQVNVFSDFNVFKDANSNICHHTGWIVLRSGISPKGSNYFPGETIDVTVANAIGGGTRFRSLTATSTGDIRGTVSYEGQTSKNAAEASPVEFYQQIFGSDFQDPNSPTFTPSPRIMARKSVLSAVMDKSKALNSKLGAEDRARLDQYFTGLRELERQLELQLTKPDPIAACVRASEPKADIPLGLNTENVSARHRLMTDLMVMAVACNQTRVFNMLYADPFAATTRTGYDKTHHQATHEEPTDVELGYQPMSSWFTERAMEEWAYFVEAFSKVKEGNRTLLDNCLIFGHSDQSLAKVHSIDGIPMFTAGSAGGRIKTGLHIKGGGDPGTRLGYTLMRLMGVEISAWGTQSNRTSKEIGEILV